MKKILFLLFIVASFITSLSSCSEDDDYVESGCLDPLAKNHQASAEKDCDGCCIYKASYYITGSSDSCVILYRFRTFQGWSGSLKNNKLDFNGEVKIDEAYEIEIFNSDPNGTVNFKFFLDDMELYRESLGQGESKQLRIPLSELIPK